MSYAGINYDYEYKDSAFNNHDRTSWLRDNFFRPRYDAPLSQTTPAHFNTKLPAQDDGVDVLTTEAAFLFPRHESSTGRTVFGTIAPSRLRRAKSETPRLPWAKLAKGQSGVVRERPMAMPPPDAAAFVAEQHRRRERIDRELANVAEPIDTRLKAALVELRDSKPVALVPLVDDGPIPLFAFDMTDEGNP